MNLKSDVQLGNVLFRLNQTYKHRVLSVRRKLHKQNSAV